MVDPHRAQVLVACPDARMPAYQAVSGVDHHRRLDQLLTAGYDVIPRWLQPITNRLGPVRRRLQRRRIAGLPPDRVVADWSFDLALAVENRPSLPPKIREGIARWRTDHFDRRLAGTLRRRHPDAALIFSDVGSHHAWPTCRNLGIPAILSLVHGDPDEELAVLHREQAGPARDFFPIYLGNSPIDHHSLDWLHQRRRRDRQGADWILAPSQHLADRLIGHGVDANRIRVIPYAAEVDRFQPRWASPSQRNHGNAWPCRFLFAGGICQRKGIRYLLEAWQRIRRPEWSLSLLGPVPHRLGEIAGPLLDGVELLGRVPHAEMPERLAQADVFVFPSLFEGSAVVTYEALACGLPIVTTAESGSVARDGIEGLIIPSADVNSLARAMDRLGTDPELRRHLARAARRRAEGYNWIRYREAVVAAIDEAVVQANCAQASLRDSLPNHSTSMAGAA